MEDIAMGLAVAGLALAVAIYNAAKVRGEDPPARIRALAALRDDGLIDEATFERKKKRLLNRI